MMRETTALLSTGRSALSRWRYVGASALTLVAGLAALASQKAWDPAAMAMVVRPQAAVTTTTTAPAATTIVAMNEYPPVTAHYPFLVDGTGLFEPCVETELRVPGAASLALVNVADDSAVQVQGSQGTFFTTVQTVGSYVATAYDGSGAIVATRNFRALYVRRELRALTDRDRNAYLDAFAVLATVSTEEGQKRFGPSFRSLDEYAQIHLIGAGGPEADHLHNGVGLSVPYWDFTIDANLIDAGTPQTELPIWDDDWFGNSSNSEMTVQHGRYAYQLIHNVNDGGTQSTIRNPYGLLRSPWNMNKSPFVTRVFDFCGIPQGGIQLANCGVHFHYAMSGGFTWRDWAKDLDGAPHGPVHFGIGGYTNCPSRDKLRAVLEPITDDFMESDVEEILLAPAGFVKQLYRGDSFAKYPTYCAADTPQADCHLECPVDGNFDRAEWNTFVDFFPDHTDKLATRMSYTDDESFDRAKPDLVAFLEVLCGSPWSPGEQADSGSPVDVSFWPMHPTLDRLLQYRRLMRPMPFDNETWPTGEQACNAGVYDLCEGHRAQDLTVGASTVSPDGGLTYQPETLTNLELYGALDPMDYKLDYIYDAFAWDHCDGMFPSPQTPPPSPV